MTTKIPSGTFAELALTEIITDQNIRSEVDISDDNGNLVQSVKNHGVLEPVIIRKTDDGKLHLRAGYRRYEAAKAAGLTKIPSMIFTVDETRGLEIALIENLQRADMNPIDRAIAFKDLVEKAGTDAKVIAERLGVSAGYISQHFAILELPTGVQKMIRAGKMEYTAARHLCRLTAHPKMLQTAVEKFESEGLTPIALETVVKNLLFEASKEPAEEMTSSDTGEKPQKTKTRAKKLSKEEMEDLSPKESILEAVKELRVKVPTETKLRQLLREYAELYVNARSPDKKREYNLVYYGIALAAGQDTKLPEV